MLIIRGGILMSTGNSPEFSSQQILAGTIVYVYIYIYIYIYVYVVQGDRA